MQPHQTSQAKHGSSSFVRYVSVNIFHFRCDALRLLNQNWFKLVCSRASVNKNMLCFTGLVLTVLGLLPHDALQVDAGSRLTGSQALRLSRQCGVRRVHCY